MDSFFKANIVNKAASVAGVTRPTNYLLDKTETASVCREFIDIIIKSCVSRAHFDEIKKTMPLTKVLKFDSTTQTNVEQVGYQLPHMYASIHGITMGCSCCCPTLRLDPNVTFSILDNQLIINSNCCMCDCDMYEKCLVYTTWDINVEQLPADLILAMVYFLASEIINRNQGHAAASPIKREAEQYLANSIKKQTRDYATPTLKCYRPFFGSGRNRL